VHFQQDLPREYWTYLLSLSLFRSTFTVRCALVSQAQGNGRVEEEKEES
jgi:hypothetical protein